MASVEIYWNQYCHYRGNYCSALIHAPTPEGRGKYCTLHFLALLRHGKKGLKHSATFVLHTLPSSCIQSSQTNVRLSPKRGKTPKTQNLKIARKLCKETNRVTVLYKCHNICNAGQSELLILHPRSRSPGRSPLICPPPAGQLGCDSGRPASAA